MALMGLDPSLGGLAHALEAQAIGQRQPGQEAAAVEPQRIAAEEAGKDQQTAVDARAVQGIGQNIDVAV